MKNKNFLKKLTAGILGFVMTLGVGAAGYAGAASETKAATKITSASSIVSGNSYYIGATTGTTDYYLNVSGSSTSESIAGTAKTSKSDGTVFVFTKSGDNWTIKFDGGSNYLGLKNGKDNGKVQVKTTACNFTITATDKSLLRISIGSYSIQKNNSGTQFGSYGNTQTDVWLEAAGSAKTVSSISLTGDMNKKTYTTADDYDPTGLTVTANYSDSSSENVTSDAEFSFNPNTLTAGMTQVTVTASYDDKTATKTVTGLTVTQSTITSCEIKTFSETSGSIDSNIDYGSKKGNGTVAPVINSNKLRLYKPSSGYSSGGILTITAKNGATITKVEYKSNRQNGSGYRLADSGDLTSVSGTGSSPFLCTISGISATYIEIVNTYTDSNDISYIKVTYNMPPQRQLTGISITSEPTKKNYSVGESFDSTGMVVKANYDDSTSETITDYTVSPSTMASTTTSVSITYNGKTATVTGIDVSNYKGIEVTGITDAKKTFTVGDKFSFGGSVNKVYGHSSGDDTRVALTSAELSQCTFNLGGTTVTTDTALTINDNGKKVVVTYNGSSSTDSTGSYTIIVNYAKPTAVNIESTLALGPDDSYDFNDHFSVSPENAKQDATFEITSTTGDLTEDDYVFDEGYIWISDINQHEGTLTVTASSVDNKEGGGKASATCVITVSADAAPVLQSLRCELGSYIANQYVTKPLDLTGVTVYAVFDKGDDVDVTSQVEWDDNIEVGGHPYGMYADPLDSSIIKDITIEEITFIADNLDSISFVENCDLTKKSYFTTDSSFDFEGLSITGLTESGSTASIVQDDVEYSAPTPAAIGAGDSQSVTITASYGGKTATKEFSGIEIKAVTLQSISASHTSDEYEIGQTLDLSKVTITGLNNDGTPATINKSDCDFSYAADAFLSAGTKTISVTHKPSGKTDTFSVKVNAKEITTTDKFAKVDFGEGRFLIGAVAKNKHYYLSTASKAIVEYGLDSDNLPTISSSTEKSAYLWNVTKDSAGNYVIKNDSGDYLYGTSSNDGIKVGTTSGTWTYDADDNTLMNNNSRFLGIYCGNGGDSDPTDWRSYTSATQANYAGSAKTLEFFSVVSTPSGVKSLAGITATYNHTGSEYHTGDSVVASDFTVKAWYDDGSTTDNVSGFTIENPTLVEGDNSIHLSYTDGSATKDCYVAVNGITTRTATVDHVYVVAGTGYKQNYYLKSGETPAWDFSNIKVVAYYTDDSTSEINLADFVNIEGNSVTHSVPTLNDKSFTVSGSYQGMAIDSAHNSIAVNVVNYEISKLDTWNLYADFTFKVMEGEKFDLANLGSVKLTYNDGTVESAQKVETLINQGKITLGLYSGSVTKDVTPDVTVTKDTVWDSDWDGYRMAISAGSGFTDKNNSFRVVPLLNDVFAPSGTTSLTLDYNSFSYEHDLPGSTGTTVGTLTLYADNDMAFEHLGAYNYSSHIALPRNSDAYLKNTTPWYGDISSIVIKKTGNTTVNSAASLWFSKDGSTWTGSTLINNPGTSGQTINAPSGGGYKYFKITTDGSNYTNIGKLEINYIENANIANTNLNGQDVATAFAKDFLANGTSENWTSMATSLSTAINALSTQEEKDIATNLLKYATANADGDIVQKAVAKYDQIIADYNLVNNDFLGRNIKATNHVITLDANGGSCSVESITMNNNTTYTDLPTPTRDHYLFDGWYTKKTAGVKVSNGDTFDSASSITLYAHWIYKYDVTLDVNADDATGGSLSASYYLKDSENDQYITISDPSREGYTLTGYKITAENATLSGNTITIPADTGGNITVTAQWSANAQTVTLNYDNGADPVIINTYYDKTVDLSKYSPTKTGYTLSGWKDADGNEYGLADVVTVKGDMLLTAQWTANTYTAIFDVNGGNPLAVNTKTVTYGQALGELPTPTKDHYVFLGWYPTKTTEVDPVTGETIYLNTKDTTYYARWAYVYDVVFNYNAEDASGGTLTATNYAVDKNNDQYITITADPVREGYTVSGYTVSSEHATIDGNVITIPAGTGGKITINVIWTANPQTVTLNYDNGADPVIINTYYDETVDLSEYSPTKTGYTLSGWKDANGNEYGLTDVITVKGDMSLTAQWEANTYTITFNGNGGSNPSSKDVTYGQVIGNLPSSERTGYDFVGWFTDPVDGIQVKGTDTYLTDDNTTVYAHWEAHSHYIIYDDGDLVSHEYNETFNLDAAPTKEGYIFVGWNCDYDDKVYEAGASFTMPDDDVIFESVWAKDISKVTTGAEANFNYEYTVSGGFQEVTEYSLRIYIEMDEVTYNYYKDQGYVFTVELTNGKNNNTRDLTQVYSWYDTENECYVFQIAFKVPNTQLDTSLTVQMVAKNSDGTVKCSSYTTTYNEAAQALYQACKDGKVSLNEDQMKALEWIINQIPTEE